MPRASPTSTWSSGARLQLPTSKPLSSRCFEIPQGALQMTGERATGIFSVVTFSLRRIPLPSKSVQPQYVTAWNNLGDAYEKAKEWRQALDAYNQALVAEPGNSVAQGRAQYCRGKVERMQLGQ